MDLTICPECGAPAEVRWRDVLESTEGPIEHVRIGCLRAHWFLLSVEWLERCHTAGRAEHAPPHRSRGAGGPHQPH